MLINLEEKSAKYTNIKSVTYNQFENNSLICYIFSFLGLPTQQQQLNNKKPEELWFKNVHSFDMDHCKNVTSFSAPNQVINESTHAVNVLFGVVMDRSYDISHID